MSYQNHSENLSPNLKNGLSSANVIHCENKDLKLSCEYTVNYDSFSIYLYTFPNKSVCK